MTPSPFEADCQRKSEALSQYHDDKLRRETCGECGVVRKYHYDTGCRFRRIRPGREWAEWCGVELPPEPPTDNYLREVIETTAPGPGGIVGLYYFKLECGHRDGRLLGSNPKRIPTTLKCDMCASEDRNERKRKMGWLNGKDPARAGVSAPAPAAAQQAPINNYHTNFTPPAVTPRGTQQFVFRKAVKYDAKLRFAISGPGGAGKTYTLLKLATALGGRIAFVDTEHGSAAKYADQFAFDVLELDTYDPAIVPDLIDAVAAQGYGILILDSWSHFWMGEGGELEQVDKITARSKSNNSWAAWRDVSPKHNKMIDAILKAPIHVMVSMRVKTEWILETNAKGKTAPRKIGLAPVMRDGVDYEFDVCGDIDQDNTLVITKSRCSKLNGEVIQQPGAKMAETLREWLASPDPNPPAPKPAPPDGPTPPPPPIAASAAPGGAARPWTNFGEMKRVFLALRDRVGEAEYLAQLDRFGWKSVSDIRPSDLERAIECYHDLMFLAEAAEERGGK